MPVHQNLPLRCLEMTPATPSRGNVVLLHGQGATLEDMVSVVEDMAFPARHLLLDGTFTVSMGDHYQGRAWFNRAGAVLEGLEESVHKIRQTLNGLAVEPEKTVIVGFSQGAAVALAATLESDSTAAGLCMLSGFIPQPQVLSERRHRVQDLYCLLCHGTHDDVVPFQEGVTTLDQLTLHGARARLVALSTSHWLSGEMVVELRRFLDERLPRAS